MKALPPPSPSLPQITLLENIKQLSCTYSNGVMCSGSAEGDSRQMRAAEKTSAPRGECAWRVCVCSAACVFRVFVYICMWVCTGVYVLRKE